LSKAEKIKILYVDDEMNNLNGFKATFRFDYNVFIAANTTQAHQHLVENPDISIILCDQRMPDKTGVQFFEEIRTEYPDPIRMLITGYTDIESVIDAINRGHIFRYIKKPWTDADIKSAIEEANKFFLTNSMLVIKKQELGKAYEDLDKFAYSVTHDMRGPLLSVQGAIDVARTMTNIDEIKEILEMMDKSVHKLDDFIKNIHEYYNLKRGQLSFTEIDFNRIIKDLEDIFQISGRVNNVRFITNLIQGGGFKSDETSIKIILNNLLSNAFKYQRRSAEDKFVELDIDVNNERALISVADNGIGIHQNYIDNIFVMFFRATSEESGSGFGLYNVKDALIRLGGTIEVASTPNEGTKFIVNIPGK